MRLDNDLAILTFKIIHQLAPQYLSNKINLASTRHAYNTRLAKNNGIFRVQNVNSFTSKSIKHAIPILWNSLPNDIKNENSLVRFKSKCKQYFKI